MNSENVTRVMSAFLTEIAAEQFTTEPVTLEIGAVFCGAVTGGHITIKKAPQKILESVVEFAEKHNVLLSIYDGGLLCDFDLCKPYESTNEYLRTEQDGTASTEQGRI